MRDFLSWQFVYMPWRILEIIRGVFKFIAHYFAVEFHVRNFFGPWHRQIATKQVLGLDLAEWGRVKVFNAFGRVVGAILRTLVLLIGGFAALMNLLVGILLLVGWYLGPFLVLGLVVWGFFYMIL